MASKAKSPVVQQIRMMGHLGMILSRLANTEKEQIQYLQAVYLASPPGSHGK